MQILPFDRENSKYCEALASLLTACFPHCYAGEEAVHEMEECLQEHKIALMALEEGQLVGFIGAIPHYGVTGWELHPLAVYPEFQGRGIGSRLVKALEAEAAKRGCITLYLGTDDEYGRTSLSGADLYDHLWEKIDGIQNLKGHPYEFYLKQGFVIVGVLPDVNGYGKPDIYMAKRLRPEEKQ